MQHATPHTSPHSGARDAGRLSRLLVAGLIAVAVPASRAHAQPFSATPSLCDATVGNLVQNCGFEAGDATGWTMMNPPGGELTVADLPTSAHTGSYVLRFSGFMSSNVMETLTTVPGARYTFTFYLVSLGVGGEPPSSSNFSAYFGGRQVFALQGQGPNFDQGYAQYSFTESATDAHTEIRFNARNASAAYNLDDVSVTLAPAAVPEPATVALVGGGLLGVGAAAWRRRRA